MSTWKKAISTLATAGLLASLLGTAFATTASAVNEGPELLAPQATEAIAGSGTTGYFIQDEHTAGVFAWKISGGTVVTATAPLVAVGSSGTVLQTGPSTYVPVSADFAVAISDGTNGSGKVFVNRTTPGTVTLTEYKLGDSGFAATGNTYELDFVNASDFYISASKSLVKIITAGTCTVNAGKTAINETAVASAPAADTGSAAATLCIVLRNGLGDPVTGATVTALISKGGLTSSAKAYAGDSDFAKNDTTTGSYTVDLYSNTLSGDATITITATNTASGTVTLPSATFKWTGKVATLTATAKTSVGYYDGGEFTAATFISKDSSGNRVASAVNSAVTSSDTTVVTAVAYDATAKKAGWVDATCVAEGTATLTVTQGTGSTKVSSNAIKVFCSDDPDSWSVAFAKSSVASGSTVAFTLTAKDADGQPAYLGNLGTVEAYASAGQLLGGPTDNGDGTWTWTYLANGTGVSSVCVVADVTKCSSITVTAGSVVASGITVRVGTGAYSATSKVARVGQTVTWRGALGTGAAGKSVAVWVRTRNSDGTVGTARKWATKTASSTGVVTFSYRSSSVRYIQIKFISGTDTTSWLGARWR